MGDAFRTMFKFSLRTLLIVVTLVAGLLVTWRIYVEPYRRQRKTMKLIRELGGKYTMEPADECLRGDDFEGVSNRQSLKAKRKQSRIWMKVRFSRIKAGCDPSIRGKHAVYA